MRSTFWNRIEIELRHDDYAGHSGREESRESEMVAFFLDCTRGAPFSFSFRSVERHGHLKQDPYNIPLAILACLLVHSDQWKAVSFELLSSEVGCLSAAKGRLPQLKKLDMTIIKDDHQGIQSMATDVFEDAPLLTQITLCEDSARRFKFNGLLLTTFNLKSLTHQQNIRTILREIQAINLVDLHISETDMEDLHIEGGELIHFPRLERLGIDEVQFLTILETPTLRHLAIDLWGVDDFSPSDNLHNARVIATFLRTLEIKLTALTIRGGYATHVEAILLLIPEVDTLGLISRDLANLFKRLTGVGTQELPFTNLFVRWPFIMDEYAYRTDVDALHDMMVRRNPPGVRCPSPKTIVIRSPEDGDTIAAHLISLCRDRGVRFAFSHEPLPVPSPFRLFRRPRS
jgi:hypothetical protein